VNERPNPLAGTNDGEHPAAQLVHDISVTVEPGSRAVKNTVSKNDRVEARGLRRPALDFLVHASVCRDTWRAVDGERGAFIGESHAWRRQETARLNDVSLDTRCLRGLQQVRAAFDPQSPVGLKSDE
jgi:hypothetical protein